MNPAEGTVVRAFVPTESLNQDCLATFAESNAPIAGATMFCAPREPAGLGKGLLISIFLPETPPTEFVYIVTVFQEGALSYGIPVLRNVEGC